MVNPSPSVAPLLTLDQLADQALTAVAAGDHVAQERLFAAIRQHAGATDWQLLANLLGAARSENTIDLQNYLNEAMRAGVSGPCYALARAMQLMKARIPPHERAANTATVTQLLLDTANATPPLLLGKLRWLHRCLMLGDRTQALKLQNEIMGFSLGARDVQTLAVMLFCSGNTTYPVQLLSHVLPQIADAEVRHALGQDLAFMLDKTGQLAAAHSLRAMLAADTKPAIAADWAWVQAWQQPVANSSATQPVTTVITTNISSKLVHYKDMAPPSGTLLRQTLESYYQQLQAPAAWPLHIYFDEPAGGANADMAAAYRQELVAIADDYNARGCDITVFTCPGIGLRQVLLQAMEDIATPYYFFLEHDWTFSYQAPVLPQLVQVLDTFPQLHSIRYNYMYNYQTQHDFTLLKLPVPAPFPLLATTYYCNQPSLVRTAKMQRDWLPLLAENKYDQHNAGAGGVEETLFAASHGFVRTCGILPVVSAMGCAVIGLPGDAPRTLHWGI
jgi:hypothetical protein